LSKVVNVNLVNRHLAPPFGGDCSLSFAVRRQKTRVPAWLSRGFVSCV